MTQKIRFEQWYDLEKTVSPDGLFDRTNTVTFNGYQVALQVCLEVLGTRTAPIPTILSVTSSPQTVAAVLRSGAMPILLDVDPKTLQMQPDLVEEVLKESGGAILVLSKPQGTAIDPALLNLAKEHKLPTIIDTRLLPPNRILPIEGLFTVYDLSVLCGGAAVVCEFKNQVHDLRLVRSGELGHSAHLHNSQAQLLESRLPKVERYLEVCQQVQAKYIERLHKLGKSDMLVFDKAEKCTYFMLRVPEVRRVIAHLYSYDVETVQGVYPLCYLSELLHRWKEKPSYPVAEGLHKEIIALPSHPQVAGKESSIINCVLEVCL